MKIIIHFNQSHLLSQLCFRVFEQLVLSTHKGHMPHQSQVCWLVSWLYFWFGRITSTELSQEQERVPSGLKLDDLQDLTLSIQSTTITEFKGWMHSIKGIKTATTEEEASEGLQFLTNLRTIYTWMFLLTNWPRLNSEILCLYKPQKPYTWMSLFINCSM